MQLMTTTTLDYNEVAAADRDEYRRRTEAIKQELKRTARGIWRMGENLLWCKSKAPHGFWLKWLEAEFSMHQTTANKFMRVAKTIDKESKLLSLPPSALYEMLDASPEAVEEVVEVEIPKADVAGKVVSLATVRAAKKKHPAAPKTKSQPRPTTRRGRQQRAVKAPAAKAKAPEIKPPNKLERVARAYQLPDDTFATRKETEDSKLIALYVQTPVYEKAKENAEFAKTSVYEVVAEAIASYAAPGPETKPVRNLSEGLRKVSEIGHGAGIDYDGEFRHVRVGDTEAKREEWLGQHFGDLVTAMRDFVAKVPANVSAEHATKWLNHNDPRAVLARQQKLAKAKKAFLPLVKHVVALLEKLEEKTDAPV